MDKQNISPKMQKQVIQGVEKALTKDSVFIAVTAFNRDKNGESVEGDNISSIFAHRFNNVELVGMLEIKKGEILQRGQSNSIQGLDDLIKAISGNKNVSK